MSSTISVDEDRRLVIDWINQLHVESDSKQRVSLLAQVEDVLLNKQTVLLNEMLKKVLELYLDTSSTVRSYLAGFILRFVQFHPQDTTLVNMRDCLEALLHLSNDASPKVLKSVISATVVSFMRAMRLMYASLIAFHVQIVFSFMYCTNWHCYS